MPKKSEQKPKTEVEKLKEQLSTQTQKNKELKKINSTLRAEVAQLKKEQKDGK